MDKRLTKKLALALLAISGLCLFGCIVGEAIQLCTPMAIVIAGCMIALAISEATER
jgi:hypothetical protein